MSQSPTLADRLRNLFSLDLRSLAILRMGLAMLLIADILFRSGDFSIMYAPTGFAPIELVKSQQQFWQWSLHFLSPSAGYQAALFFAAALFALALFAGWHTRIATIASWVLLTSLHVRLPIVLSAADQLLRMLVFWGMFLPLGATWSLDARRREPPRSMRVISIGTVALILQIAVLYWSTGWAKYNDDWLKDNALSNILSTALFSSSLGRALGQYDQLTMWMTRGTVWFELLAPLLLFIPYQTARLRTLVVVAFLLFHVGIACTMVVGLFSFVAIIAWLALLPTEFWNRILGADVAEPLRAAHPPTIEQGAMPTALRGHASAEDPPLVASAPSVDATLRAAIPPESLTSPPEHPPDEHPLPRPNPWLGEPPRHRRRAMRAAQRNQPVDGAMPAALHGHARRKLCHAVANLLCTAALALVLYSNWCGVGPKVLADPVHGWLAKASQVAYVYQSWGMFGIVGPHDCWFAYQALLKDGRRIDLLSREIGDENGEPMLSWQNFPNDRWRKLHWNLISDKFDPYRHTLAEYICRRWNETHDDKDQIVRFDLQCNCAPYRLAKGEDRYVHIILAEVVADPAGGNFAEAVRELNEPF
jgi:hypothetical protein